jgi:hypothetical protein
MTTLVHVAVKPLPLYRIQFIFSVANGPGSRVHRRGIP